MRKNEVIMSVDMKQPNLDFARKQVTTSKTGFR
jgi:hypothetical protein